MRSFVLLAALIFSATLSNSYSQTPAQTPDPEIDVTVASPTPTELPKELKIQDIKFPYVRPDPKTRFKRYINGMIGPIALAKQVAGAGIGTWRNSPEEWGGQWEGFGKRLASGFGKNLIKQTTTYGLDEALKLDSHYYRSKKKDAGSKIRNALLSPITARNTSGERVIGIPKIVG